MPSLKVEKREIFGKKLLSHREQGLMPIVVYGSKEEVSHYFVIKSDFQKIWKMAGESTIITLKSGTDEEEVLCYAVDYHPLSGEPLHADFLIVDKTKKVEITVPLVFEGVSPAIKELGGTLIRVLHELNISALPKDLPKEIVVRIDSLKTPEDQIMIKDLNISKDVEILADSEEVIAMISLDQSEAEDGEVGNAEASEVDFANIQVEKKGKKDSEESSE